MSLFQTRFAVTMTALTLSASGVLAQTASPTAPAPQTKEPGEQTIVVNPTVAECTTGWTAELKWSKAQFDQFCSTLSKSK